jgi:hypothetical protein
VYGRDGAGRSCPKPKGGLECNNRIFGNEVWICQNICTHSSTCWTIVVVPAPKFKKRIKKNTKQNYENIIQLEFWIKVMAKVFLT